MRRWQIVTALLPFLFMALDYAGCENRDWQFVADAKSGDTSAIRAGLEEGVGIDARGEGGKTALEWAVHMGQVDNVRLLLNHGADPKRAMDDAVTSGLPHIVVMLAKAGARFSGPQGVSALCSAAERRDSATVSTLLRYGIDVNADRLDSDDNHTYMTPILCAARSGSWEAFRILADRGAHFTALSMDHKTALILTADSGTADSAAICRYLIRHGLDVNAVDDQGETALKVAVSTNGEGAQAVRAILLQNGGKMSADRDINAPMAGGMGRMARGRH